MYNGHISKCFTEQLKIINKHKKNSLIIEKSSLSLLIVNIQMFFLLSFCIFQTFQNEDKLFLIPPKKEKEITFSNCYLRTLHHPHTLLRHFHLYACGACMSYNNSNYIKYTTQVNLCFMNLYIYTHTHSHTHTHISVNTIQRNNIRKFSHTQSQTITCSINIKFKKILIYFLIEG